MKEKKVTVIIPTFNRADIIPRAINSVINQTYQNWELVIIDDGSTDNTKDVIKKFLKDRRVKYFYQNNGGVCSARNLGINKTTGDYIAFLDSDDEFLKEKIEKQIDEIKEHEADMVLCNVFEYRENKRIKNRFNFKKSFWVKQEDIVNYKIPMSASFMFLKTKLAKQILFDEKMPSSNDFDFVLRTSLKGARIFFINQRLVNNYKSIKRKRISTNFESKIRGYETIVKKIKSNRYNLNKLDKKTILKKTYSNLALFYFLSGQYDKGKKVCQKIIIERSGKKVAPKTFFLYIINTFPLFGKVLFFFGKTIWGFGLIQN